MPQTRQELVQENELLRIRLRELEAALTGKPKRTRTVQRRSSKNVPAPPAEPIGETGRLLRALSATALESARIQTRVLADLAGEVFAPEESRGCEPESTREMDLPRRLFFAGFNAWADSLRINAELIRSFSNSLSAPAATGGPVER